MTSPKGWSFPAVSSKYRLTASEQSIRLATSSRKIVLSNDGAAERILHFAAIVLPPKQAMSYLMNFDERFLSDGVRAPASSWRNIT
jgi:hypothetical protein